MIPSKAKTPAVFLDRDGTIMRDADYCSDPRQVEVFLDVPQALSRVKTNGYKLIVITNQSGINRGFFTLDQYHAVEAEVLRQLGGDLIDATYFCAHRPDEGCKCRKPSPEMIRQAAREHHVDLARSFFIGDKASDVESGRHAGVKTILVRTGYGKKADAIRANFVAEDLNGAANIILEEAL